MSLPLTLDGDVKPAQVQSHPQMVFDHGRGRSAELNGFRFFGWRGWLTIPFLLMICWAFFLAASADCALAEDSVPADSRVETAPKGATATPGQQAQVHVAFVIMTTTSPHALTNEKYGLFDKQLATMGRKVKYTGTRSLDNLFPLLDNPDDSPDFVYIPHTAFVTYATKTSRFGGGDKYAIVAGSLDLSDIDLVVRPEIASLKDLSGKKIAISNLRYMDEFHLNKLLATVGLSTETMGGNVEIVWDDIVRNTMENYANGLYDGIVVFNTDNRDLAIRKVPGSSFYKLNPEDLYGGQHPRVWLVAKKDIIKNDPALVKGVLRAHILLDDKAKEDRGELAEINRRVFLNYFKQLGVDLSDSRPIDKYEERWEHARITYDPNIEFIQDMFNFLKLKGLTQGMSLDDFIRIEPLNEVLEEMGRPKIGLPPG